MGHRAASMAAGMNMVMVTVMLAGILLGPAAAPGATNPAPDPLPAAARVAADLATCETLPANVATMAQEGCYERAGDAADKILSDFERTIAGRLKAERVASPELAKDDDEVSRRLEAARRAWLAYREAQCALSATDMLGGSGEALSASACLFQETQARIRRLADWFKNSPFAH